jgi:hypothetical protein
MRPAKAPLEFLELAPVVGASPVFFAWIPVRQEGGGWLWFYRVRRVRSQHIKVHQGNLGWRHFHAREVPTAIRVHRRFF